MVLEIWNTIFIFDLSRTNFWQISLRVWSFQNLLSMFGFWGIFFYKLIHMFELCGNFLLTNKFLCFNFVEFVFEILISTFWTFWICFGQIICFWKKKIENWTWWIVLTNWFLCFNFAECDLKKLIFTYELFAKCFQPFFSILFLASTCEKKFGQINCLLCFNFCGKLCGIFFFIRASFNTPKGVCVWLEIFGIIDFYAFNELFWYKIWSNYVQFQTSVEESDEEAFSHPLASSRRCKKLWGRCCTSGFSWGGPSGGILSQNFHFSEKIIIYFLIKIYNSRHIWTLILVMFSTMFL